ncbi:MAG TPA: OsmC family protein [Candidatus Acidoferrales bacterium]|nr:OsmC family protein [Candidatus Acidoferrales bacterium]
MQTARLKWTEREQFAAVTPSGHDVPFDADRQHNSAPGPMEMLLAALGACTATDVVIILGKKRQKLEALEVIVSGERAPDPPQVWTTIEIVYTLRGTLDEKAVRDTIELSENKYCSVAAMLRKTAKISFRFEILPAA